MHYEDIAKSNLREPALRYENKVIHHQDLYQYVIKLTEFLLKNDYSQGDVLAIGHTKKPLSYALMLAALRIGISYVILDVNSPVDRTKKILDVCQPRSIFYDDIILSCYMEEISEICQIKALLIDIETNYQIFYPFGMMMF